MGPKRDTSTCIDELVTVLKDERVLEALGSLFESKLQPFITLISKLKSDNVILTTKVTQLESDLISADKKIDALEAYTRADNLIIVGLPSTNYVDAAKSCFELLPEQAGHFKRDPRHFDRIPSKEVHQLDRSSPGDCKVHNPKSA